MWDWIKTNPDTPSVMPESFSEAIRALFRQWAQCKKLDLAYQEQPKGSEGQEKLSALEDTLTDMILFAKKIEEKFWWKMNSDDREAFKNIITVTSEKMTYILQKKRVIWGDGEDFFLRFLNIANQIEQWTCVLSEVTKKVRWRIAHNSSNSSGPYFI